jgi:RNA polymerase sigma-70 factor (ECF subfamily)
LAVAVADLDRDQAQVVAAQHDPRAFAPLYLRYVDLVYAYCQRRLGTQEAAEDATSLVFIKALAALPRYHAGDGTFRGWLFAIAHNVVIDSQRAVRPTQPLVELGELCDGAPGPDEAALAAEAERTMRTVLTTLAPEQRRVLELRLAGLSTAEISTALGRRPGAVRALQFRAVSRLRGLLRGPDAGEADDG